ncbi:nuclear transport factor 2 isoform 1-T2 [Rhinophrynus dorsalis]
MAEIPIWEQIGSSFITLYYQHFDNCREQLHTLYIDDSCLSWEGQHYKGKAAIMEKVMGLPFQSIQHSITAHDHQPVPPDCVLTTVVGQLKADNDPVIGFHQLFVLKRFGDKWVCTNDIFRLALHNFA